jgi:hypothetical protein
MYPDSKSRLPPSVAEAETVVDLHLHMVISLLCALYFGKATHVAVVDMPSYCYIISVGGTYILQYWQYWRLRWELSREPKFGKCSSLDPKMVLDVLNLFLSWIGQRGLRTGNLETRRSI